MLRRAPSTALRTASETSLALPVAKPTRPLPSPTATSALNEKRRPPFTTLATRLIATTFSMRSEPSRDCWSPPRPPRPPSRPPPSRPISVDSLADCLGDFVGLARRETDATLAVADRHERVERKAAATFHDLGDAIDRDHVFHEVRAFAGLLVATASTATAVTTAAFTSDLRRQPCGLPRRLRWPCPSRNRRDPCRRRPPRAR